MNIRLLIFLTDWICCFMDMLCGLIGFVTLTLYRPWWDFKFRAYTAKYVVTLRMKQLNK